MLLKPVLLGTSTAAAAGGGGGGGGGEAVELISESAEEERARAEEEGDRNSAGGNRWPRQETLALLKIRSEMDPAFREANPKAPLWDEVSRKMGEMGYNRNGKKCKEKFENIYKYHRRTKEGRSGREHGKNYRFFDQLEVFDNQSSLPSGSSDQIQRPATVDQMEIPSTPVMSNPIGASQDSAIPCPAQDINLDFMSTFSSSTSSSGRDSNGSFRKKRRMSDYFEKMINVVLERQEILQNKFLEAIDKYEKARLAREESWKAQEMARIKREQALLAHERAVAATKDAAVIAFLEKISGQEIQLPFPLMVPVGGKQDDNVELLVRNKENTVNFAENDISKQGNDVGENWSQASSSRWPKEEVEALIRLRSNFDLHYQENGPKGPLWEQISSEMKKLGYDRNAKRCKEKWENINKYYKRVRDSNKKRPEDSKTCPYYHLLESLYEFKSKRIEHSSESSGCNLKPEYILMQMMGQEEQQQQPQLQEPQQSVPEYGETEKIHQNEGNNLANDEGDGYRCGDTDLP